VAVHRPVERIESLAEDPLAELLAREDDAGRVGEDVEEVELHAREIQAVGAAHDLAPGQVDREVEEGAGVHRATG
jgi:hypothetical protein